jgi:hypothetical protein
LWDKPSAGTGGERTCLSAQTFVSKPVFFFLKAYQSHLKLPRMHNVEGGQASLSSCLPNGMRASSDATTNPNLPKNEFCCHQPATCSPSNRGSLVQDPAKNRERNFTRSLTRQGPRRPEFGQRTCTYTTHIKGCK